MSSSPSSSYTVEDIYQKFLQPFLDEQSTVIQEYDYDLPEDMEVSGFVNKMMDEREAMMKPIDDAWRKREGIPKCDDDEQIGDGFPKWLFLINKREIEIKDNCQEIREIVYGTNEQAMFDMVPVMERRRISMRLEKSNKIQEERENLPGTSNSEIQNSGDVDSENVKIEKIEFSGEKRVRKPKKCMCGCQDSH
ncbi:hypothetical protein B9Z55_015741 [Caenorhabditis nigoni]|uniref:Uncharacterized protein n=1 Tax=Caenorhabditis nigoni TaxID=1611254 RepID=A0A2G5UCE6_9PELO|nr:hypothetical protein B9Z55_015741 [Caenorhabditis nigoni]